MALIQTLFDLTSRPCRRGSSATAFWKLEFASATTTKFSTSLKVYKAHILYMFQDVKKKIDKILIEIDLDFQSGYLEKYS